MNLNDKVRFRLTQEGAAAWARQSGHVLAHEANATVEDQLWAVMRHLGPEMSLTSPQMIEGNEVTPCDTPPPGRYRAPFKCPACDGWGARGRKINDLLGSGPLESCHACGGKGIVWTP